MIPFKLTLTLATPFISDFPITLDGILSAAIFRKLGHKGADTIPFIPLMREQGIFKSSSLHYTQNFTHTTIPRVMSLRGESDLSINAFAPNSKKGARYLAVDKKRGPYKTNLESIQAIDAPEVFFWAVGNPEEVVQLILDYIPGIGKRSNAGAGQILDVFFEYQADDYSWVSAKGLPARPLPVSIWSSISDIDPSSLPRAPMAVDVPYWSGESVEAVFPSPIIHLR